MHLHDSMIRHLFSFFLFNIFAIIFKVYQSASNPSSSDKNLRFLAVFMNGLKAHSVSAAASASKVPNLI